ncbi:MAG: zinc ribbon domain-containing protein [Phycisphaerales bacterium]
MMRPIAMETLQIHCPSCGVRLDVPANAGGRPARCPKCKTRFRVPEPHVMMDETVTCWLNLDQIHKEEDREEQIDEHLLARMQAEDKAEGDAAAERAGELGSSVIAHMVPDAPVPAAPAALPTPRKTETIHGSSAAVYSQSSPPQEVSPPPVPPPAPEGRKEGAGTRDRVVRRVVRRQNNGETNGANGAATGRAGGVVPRGDSRRFLPADPEMNRIKLYVLGVGAYGVRFGFSCHLLDNAAFRASMPMRGVVSGESDAGKLIARPLAWVDKATGHFTNPGELEARYEVHVKLNQTPGEVVESMRPMDELPTPFNLPMPYYVGREDTGQGSLHCETVATPHGIQCEVSIPSIRYAMDWLGRVNGVCGPEYQRLETEAMKFEAGAWRTIPQQVRHRLAIWFEFQGDEQFLAYFGDSDFARSDLGLAGLIVTTRRIVWCKYHHHGSASMEETGLLTAVERGRFADLNYRGPDGSRRKMVRLRCEDVDALADLLAERQVTMAMQIETAQREEEPGVSDSGVIGEAEP